MGALGAAGTVDANGVAATVVAVEVATFIAVGGAVGAVQPASANRIVARTSGLTGATTLRLRLTVFTSVDWLICSESFVSNATLQNATLAAASSEKTPPWFARAGFFGSPAGRSGLGGATDAARAAYLTLEQQLTL